ncbi:MAG: TRAM domain-containing protein [Bacteroidales bacterium]|nr:TRAM domain-containing protein [Bacteroidales bacterium]
MEDDVAPEVKQQRAERIMALQETISLQHNTAKVGKEFTVVIDREDPEYYAGRTEFDSPEVDNEILIRKTVPLKPGDFVNVVVEDAQPFDLYGSVKE